MGKCLVQGKDGSMALGEYDGYGGLDGAMGHVEGLADRHHFELWHQTCFKLMGRPEYSGPSRSAFDQGMPPADELREPTSLQDLEALRELGAKKERENREKLKRLLGEPVTHQGAEQ